MRCEDGFVEVRHPAYWFFRDSEPPEALILELEAIAKKRPLSIYEYARLARFVETWTFSEMGASIPASSGRAMKNLRGLLLRFDGQPLADAFPPLYVLGSLKPAVQQAIVERGLLFDDLNSRGAWDRSPLGLDHVSAAGPLYGATVTGAYLPPIYQTMPSPRDTFAVLHHTTRFFSVVQAGAGSYDFILSNPTSRVATFHMFSRPNN
jgi:hypothetical protein